MAPAVLETKPRILYLDAYDSFSNNIVSQVEQSLNAEVTSIRIDDPVFSCASNDSKQATFVEYLGSFDGVIAGPGPGWANNERDVGLMQELWKLEDEHVLPVIGICLGFQSLSLAFGAETNRLVEPRHGLVAEILHKNKSIFSGVDQLLATQYHSLEINIGHPIQTKRAVSYPGELWASTEKCPELEPLAWDFDNRRNGAVLMAVKHTSKPFYGVQFHPESICTNSQGTRIIKNWWEEAVAWNRQQRANRPFPITTSIAIPAVTTKENSAEASKVARLIAHGDGNSLPDLPPGIVHCSTVGSGRLTVADVCELFEIPRKEAIVLESGLQPNLVPLAVGTGRYSIIGLIIPEETLRLHYYTATRIMQLRDGNDRVQWEAVVHDPWNYLKTIMQHLKPSQTPKGPAFAPFWGGLMGYVSYEAGLDTIDVKSERKAESPDICFAYITRSIVFDHQVKKIYVQSIRGRDDTRWVSEALEKIYEAAFQKSEESTPSHTPMPKADPFETDADLNNYLASCQKYVADRTEYCKAVAACQEFIADGHSYEICLTSQNQIRVKRQHLSLPDNNRLSWKLYKNLTNCNPAPFGAYIRLHNLHVLSSSPERYISWDRNQNAQCRPIKGTVQKRDGFTREDANAILSSPKERAENLMIVDLVRHQLHGVYGSGNVNVSQLMEVEEYETLWQLVSVVDAIPAGTKKPRTPHEWKEPADYVSGGTQHADTETLGFDAFVHSLPAGSMTGAPKKRSCELLQEIENHEPRGIYSGVLGYLDVGGGGDFSVVIRTAVKVDGAEADAADEDIWRIGAGGAVTSQSTTEGEYDEMRGKFMSTSRAFDRVEPRRVVPEALRLSRASSAFGTRAEELERAVGAALEQW